MATNTLRYSIARTALVIFTVLLVAGPVCAAVTDLDCRQITDPNGTVLTHKQNGVFTLKPGVNYTLNLTFKNTGRTEWNVTKKIVGLAPKGEATRKFNESIFLVDELIPPGSSYSFIFNITPPQKSGLYQLHWQMFKGTPKARFGPTRGLEVRVR